MNAEHLVAQDEVVAPRSYLPIVAISSLIFNFYLLIKLVSLETPSLSLVSTYDLVSELYIRSMDSLWLILPIMLVLLVLMLIGLYVVLRFFLEGVSSYTTILRNSVSADISPYSMVERYIPGSEYHTIKKPSFQCEIAVRDGDSYKIIGQGFRYGNDLITAGHVVSDTESIRLVSGEFYRDINVRNFENNHDDVAIIHVSPSDWSYLRMSTCKFAKTMVEGSPTVTISGIGNMGSIGLLEAARVLGRVYYKGSTSPGYSGAPYHVANMVYGMHLGASSANYGIDGNYIQALLGRESSEDWVYEEIARLGSQGFKAKANRSPFSPNEALVKIKGRLHVVDMEEYGDLYDFLDFEANESDRGYKESAKEKVSVLTLLNKQTVTDSVFPVATAEVPQSQQRGNVSLQSIQKRKKQKRRYFPQADSVGQGLTLVQSDGAIPSTSRLQNVQENHHWSQV